jgi:regulator of replication initiation timing
MTILEVPDTAGGRTVEVLALVNRMIASPGPLTNNQKTIINQVHSLLTSFVNFPDITNNIANLRTQSTKLSVKNAELATRNVTLQTENEGLTLDLQNSRSATAAVNSLLEDARKTITSLEKRPEPMQTETHHTCIHDHALAEDRNREIEIQVEVLTQLRSDLDAERAVSRTLARNTNATPVTTATTFVPAPQKIPDPEKYGGD